MKRLGYKWEVKEWGEAVMNDHSSQRIEGQGHRSHNKVWVMGQANAVSPTSI